MRYKKKNFFTFVFLSSMFLLLVGCATARGMAEDAKNTWTFLNKADAWMRKNLW